MVEIPCGRLLPLIRRGRTILRALMELRLDMTQVDGLTVDLGSGGSSNFELMRRSTDACVLKVDLWPEARPDLIANLESPLPLASASVDGVMLLNVLEHMYGYEQILCEIGRVLRPGGLLVMATPFLFPVHTAWRGDLFTDDYFRWTGSALRRLLVGPARFSGPIRISACDLGPFAAAASLITPELRWALPRVMVAGCAFALDGVLRRLREGRDGMSRSEWVIGYYVEAIK
jgi:SAM-dependent methyltransferase